MGRTVSANLQNLLNLQSCKTQTTIDINRVDLVNHYFAVEALSTGGHDYTDDLRTTSDLKQNIYAPPDRVTASIQNVDKAFGNVVTVEDLVKARAILGRIYHDPAGVLPSVWVELFRGELKPTQLDQSVSENEILSDLVAAGYCVADQSLAPNCQLKYKGLACGYSGGLTTCNKKRKSPEGCAGHILTGIVTNEHRYGGMEFPGVQVPAAPTGGGDPPPDPPHECPRADQWIPVRGGAGSPTPILASELTDQHEAWNPITRTFHRVASADIARDQEIWMIETLNGGRGFSSATHPIIRDLDDTTGLRVDRLESSHPVLTWLPNSLECLLSYPGSSDAATPPQPTSGLGDVVHIELEDGFIYCYSDDPAGPFIVCHNRKPIP